jgi:hypothetical protein
MKTRGVKADESEEKTFEILKNGAIASSTRRR